MNLTEAVAGDLHLLTIRTALCRAFVPHYPDHNYCCPISRCPTPPTHPPQPTARPSGQELRAGPGQHHTSCLDVTRVLQMWHPRSRHQAFSAWIQPGQRRRRGPCRARAAPRWPLEAPAPVARGQSQEQQLGKLLLVFLLFSMLP